MKPSVASQVYHHHNSIGHAVRAACDQRHASACVLKERDLSKIFARDTTSSCDG